MWTLLTKCAIFQNMSWFYSQLSGDIYNFFNLHLLFALGAADCHAALSHPITSHHIIQSKKASLKHLSFTVCALNKNIIWPFGKPDRAVRNVLQKHNEWSDGHAYYARIYSFSVCFIFLLTSLILQIAIMLTCQHLNFFEHCSVSLFVLFQYSVWHSVHDCMHVDFSEYFITCYINIVLQSWFHWKKSIIFRSLSIHIW